MVLGDYRVAPGDRAVISTERLFMKSWASMSLWLGIFVIVIPITGALGARFDLWPFNLGLHALLICAAIAGVQILSSLIGWIVSALKRSPGKAKFIIGGLLSGALLVNLAFILVPGIGSPMLAGVSTDLDNPPKFSQYLIDLRGPEANPVGFSNGMKGKVRRSFPELTPWKSLHSASTLAGTVERTIESLGWQYHGKETDPVNPEVETYLATDTTFWFGFKDDIAIRLFPLATGGTIVDVHSVSRVGIVDLGVNARRVANFLDVLRDKAGS